jgi:hypothetical protein
VSGEINLADPKYGTELAILFQKDGLSFRERKDFERRKRPFPDLRTRCVLGPKLTQSSHLESPAKRKPSNNIATTHEKTKGGQFVIGAQALPGAPYDGHTLDDQIYQAARLTGVNVKRVYVDRGYRGHKIEREGLDITLSQTRGVKTPIIRHVMRRRSAINAILCAAGHNMRLLARWIRLLFALLRATSPNTASPNYQGYKNRAAA